MDWLCNSLLHNLDIFAGYEIDFLLKKQSPLFQFEIAFFNNWIFLTPKGGWGEETSVFVEKTILVTIIYPFERLFWVLKVFHGVVSFEYRKFGNFPEGFIFA